MTNGQRIAEIRERAEKATPGPWNHSYYNSVSSAYNNIGDMNTEGNAEFIAHSREDIEWLLSQLAASQSKMTDKQTGYRFYYCDSEDSYLLGKRVDNFYYAHWHKKHGFVFDMSKVLPWVT